MGCKIWWKSKLNNINYFFFAFLLYCMCKSPLFSLCCLTYTFILVSIRSQVHRGHNFRPPLSPAISSSFSWGGLQDVHMGTWEMFPRAHPGSNPGSLNRICLKTTWPDTWTMICNFNLTSSLTFELLTLSPAQKLIWTFLFFHMKGSEYRLIHTFREFPSSFLLFLDWYRITQMLIIVPHIGQVKYITLFISASWQLGKRNELSEFDDGSDHLQTCCCWAFPSLEWSRRNSSEPQQGSWAAKAYWPLLVWASRQTTHFQSTEEVFQVNIPLCTAWSYFSISRIWRAVSQAQSPKTTASEWSGLYPDRFALSCKPSPVSAEGHCSLLVEDNLQKSARKQGGNPKATKHDTIRHSAATRNAVCIKNPMNRFVDKRQPWRSPNWTGNGS